MNKTEIKTVVRLVIQVLIDRNLLSLNKTAGVEKSAPADDGCSEEKNPGITGYNPGQVLTAGKVRNIAGTGDKKIVVPRSTIITGLAAEEAGKLQLEIIEE